MYEYAGNLHMHTPFSDGMGTCDEIASAALRAGLDFVIVTDHNVWVEGPEGYYYQDDRRVLLLVGEEIHDQVRVPQKNHLLVMGVDRELARWAPEPQRLLSEIARVGGLSFFAHPVDPAAPKFRQGDLSWVEWDLEGYTGIEIWNFMSDYKARLTSIPAGLFYSYSPLRVARGPVPEAMQRWDQLLAQGRRVVGIGGSDAHGLDIRAGPLRAIVFPYEFLFRAVNTHILTDEPLTGDATADRSRIYQSLREGHCFVGYDLPASTKGFRFTAQGKDRTAIMGDALVAKPAVTLQAWIPRRADFRLLRNGHVLREVYDQQSIVEIVKSPGVYRLEATIEFRGRRRSWILSNPIYVTDGSTE
jgi:hypothetical protein